MKYTVTVGIPVYNEENNIGQLIESILKQDTSSFILDNIIVISDGSTDRTGEIVQSFEKKYPMVSFISDGERKSKCFRLNQLYQMNESDILITFDGDIGLSNNTVLENMVNTFNDDNISLVAAYDQPTKPTNIQQRIINAWYEVWGNIRVHYKNGSNIYNLHGNATALRKNLAREIEYPVGITADQDYLYLSTVKKNNKFAYARNAIILFHTPEFFSEFFSQTTRFLTEKQVLYDIFGPWISAEYYIPKLFQIKEILRSFVNEPLFTVLAFMMYFVLITFIHESDPLHKKGMWQQVKSTKKAVGI